MFGNKGLLFIVDIIISLAVVSAILIFIFSITPKQTLKQTNDLVYLEATSFLTNSSISYDCDFSKEYICRDFNRYVPLGVIKEKVCVNIVGR